MFNFLSHKQQEVQKPSKSNMERSLESNQAISSNPVTIGKGQQSPQYPGMQREEKKITNLDSSRSRERKGKEEE